MQARALTAQKSGDVRRIGGVRLQMQPWTDIIGVILFRFRKWGKTMPSKAQLPEPRDIFDRIMGLPGLRHFYGLYAKYKSVLLYIFFGGLTTVISIGSFALCNQWLMVNELIANVISWICAVSFAYVTNRVWVFRSSAKGARQILSEALSFFSGRLVTLGIEEMMLLVFVTIARMNGMVIKVIAQFVVLVLNYFISKLVVFRSKAGK